MLAEDIMSRRVEITQIIMPISELPLSQPMRRANGYGEDFMRISAMMSRTSEMKSIQIPEKVSKAQSRPMPVVLAHVSAVLPQYL